MAVAVVVLPWEAWAYAHCGKVILLSTIGPASVLDGLTYSKATQGTVPVWVPADVAKLMADLEAKHAAKEVQTAGDIAGWLLRQAADQPVAVAKLIGLKTVRCWYATDSHRHETPILLFQLAYLGLAMAGGVAAWRKGGSYRWLVALLLSFVLCHWVMAVMVLSILNYMVPAFAFLFLLVPALLGGNGGQNHDQRQPVP